MNNKVSNIQIGMFLTLILCSIYLGISDIILFEKAKNEVLISMLLGSLLGLIPVLMYLKINSSYTALNIYEKNIKLFGKLLGNILNILIITIYIIMLTIAVRSVVSFVTSKYLQETPYILTGMLVIVTSLIICFRGLETIARVSQICFCASIIFMFIIEIFLSSYIEPINILPILTGKNYVIDILKGAIYYASSSSLLTILLLTINKDKIKNPKKYNKTIILFYLFSSISLFVVMFFVVSCFGYKIGSLFRYPEYVLLKKIGISSSALHLENLLAFRWILYMLALANISTYGIMCGIKSFIKNKKISKIIIIIISIICMYLGKIIFKEIPHSIILIKKYYVPFIAGPMIFILVVIYIRCLFIRKKS